MGLAGTFTYTLIPWIQVARGAFGEGGGGSTRWPPPSPVITWDEITSDVNGRKINGFHWGEKNLFLDLHPQSLAS